MAETYIPPVKVTFGIIVLNGEPFVPHTLRALYPFAHEIIVVEGAAHAAKNIATPDGHSRDNTREALESFRQSEDPENKLIIVTAERDGYPDGFWPGEKDEQSQAYAKRATGDYLWQVDIDEFYLAADMKRVFQMLSDDPEITAMTFKQLTFWGGLDYQTDGWYLRRGATYYHRLFKWGPGYTYTTHRPPTVHDDKNVDVRTQKWIRGQETEEMELLLYHYSLLLPKQVIEKCDYYGNAAWAKRGGAVTWAKNSYLSLQHPFRIHNVYSFPSWLQRYTGPHPDHARQMVEELKSSPTGIELRKTDDIERLLNSWWYPWFRECVIKAEHWDSVQSRFKNKTRRAFRRAFGK